MEKKEVPYGHFNWTGFNGVHNGELDPSKPLDRRLQEHFNYKGCESSNYTLLRSPLANPQEIGRPRDKEELLMVKGRREQIFSGLDSLSQAFSQGTLYRGNGSLVDDLGVELTLLKELEAPYFEEGSKRISLYFNLLGEEIELNSKERIPFQDFLHRISGSLEELSGDEKSSLGFRKTYFSMKGDE